MPKPFIQLTIPQFAERLRAFTFTRPVTAVHMHHTFIPRKVDHRGLSTIEGMFKFHTQTRGFNDIAQHLSIAPDGTVWTGRDWNRTPASATGFNTGAFMFETIGDFDTGEESLEGAQRQAVIDVIAMVQLKCGLPVESLHFHREFTDAKTCPGTGISKADILNEVRQARVRLAGGSRDFVLAPNVRASSTSRHASAQPLDSGGSTSAEFGQRAMRPFPDSQIATLDTDDDEGEVDCGAEDALREMAETPRSRGNLGPDDLAFLRRYVINLRQGQFSAGGLFKTTKADVNAIIGKHLPAALAEAKKKGEKLRIAVWAHGGLVDEASGLGAARVVIPWWVSNQVYPIYFVWETGLFETITQLIKGRRDLAARDLADFTDQGIETLVRAIGGGKIWDGMKMSAQRSVEPDGGAQFVAEKLAAFCAANEDDVELHGVGHSAGAIFHSYFVPAMLAHKSPAFTTLSFLAPAIRVSEFTKRLVPHLGTRVKALTMFTMNDDLERDDNCASLYQKSLLYLIHLALEARRGEPILGLEDSITGSAELKALFGLSGSASPHEVVFSKTAASSGRSATQSTTHGGFDNDRPTMESVLRRIIDAGDTASIAAFPATAARAFSFDAALTDADTAAAPTATKPARTPQAPAIITAGSPRLFRALCVGIDKYPGRAALSGCVNDAKDWSTVFDGLGFEQVDLLLDKEATQDRLRTALRDLVQSGHPGDALVFQYSGHGTSFDDQPGTRHDEDDGKDEAIVPVDFQKGRFILDDELFEIFDELRDGVALTCFFDCCHSGTMSRAAISSLTLEVSEAGAGDVRPRFIPPTPAMVEAYRRQRAVTRKRSARGLRDADALKGVVFSACRDDEVALESAGHGAFTVRVVPLVQAAFTARTTNEAFQQLISNAFGSPSSQNPALDCARRARAWSILRGAGTTVGAPTASPVDSPSRPSKPNGHGNGEHGRTADAWNALLNPLYEMEADTLEKLIHEAERILSSR